MKSSLFLIISLCCAIGLKAQIKGKISETPISWGQSLTFHSEILQADRTLNIVLPQGYSASDTTRYPVIYFLDGGLDEDFFHLAGLVYFQSFPWINSVPPCILVGIANGANRVADMTFPNTLPDIDQRFNGNGQSARFMNYIENEVFQLINARYHTKSHRTLIGQSLAGLFTTEVLLKKPDLFTNYLIVSPSLWWDDGSLLRFPDDQIAIDANQRIFIAVGQEGLAPCKNPHVMEVDANLMAEKLRKKTTASQLTFQYFPDENHATLGHEAVYRAFKHWYPPHP